MDLNLNGKNALVCGSSKGIGLAIAVELAACGANVTLMARDERTLVIAKDSLSAKDGQHHDILIADSGNTTDLKEKILELVSAKSIHILINNSSGPAAGPIYEADPADFINAYHSHLIANHILTVAVVAGMKADNYGRIINVISTSVKIPLNGLGVSNTTRGAVASWAKTMSNELAQFGITVNNILPGATETERLSQIIQNKATKLTTGTDRVEAEMKSEIPMKRFAKPQEIAALAAFLASPSASYITGTSIPVDGGRTGSI
jgi:3-oxoacyl-[acyl-carrier protein] reductase